LRAGNRQSNHTNWSALWRIERKGREMLALFRRSSISRDLAELGRCDGSSRNDAAEESRLARMQPHEGLRNRPALCREALFGPASARSRREPRALAEADRRRCQMPAYSFALPPRWRTIAFPTAVPASSRYAIGFGPLGTRPDRFERVDRTAAAFVLVFHSQHTSRGSHGVLIVRAAAKLATLNSRRAGARAAGRARCALAEPPALPPRVLLACRFDQISSPGTQCRRNCDLIAHCGPWRQQRRFGGPSIVLQTRHFPLRGR